MRNPKRLWSPARDALHALWRKRSGTVPVAEDWQIVAGRVAPSYRYFGCVYRPDGSRVPVKLDGGYSVKPSAIKALSPEARAWFRATLRNVRDSDARIKAMTTIRTIAELNPAVAARERRLRAWATGGKPDATATRSPWDVCTRCGKSVPWRPGDAVAVHQLVACT